MGTLANDAGTTDLMRTVLAYKRARVRTCAARTALPCSRTTRFVIDAAELRLDLMLPTTADKHADGGAVPVPRLVSQLALSSLLPAPGR